MFGWFRSVGSLDDVCCTVCRYDQTLRVVWYQDRARGGDTCFFACLEPIDTFFLIGVSQARGSRTFTDSWVYLHLFDVLATSLGRVWPVFVRHVALRIGRGGAEQEVEAGDHEERLTVYGNVFLFHGAVFCWFWYIIAYTVYLSSKKKSRKWGIGPFKNARFLLKSCHGNPTFR